MASGLLFGINAALNLALTLALARLMSAAGYGVLAAWSAASLFTATAAFDWIRFAAMRFYTPVSRQAEPEVRATLDVSFLTGLPLALALLGTLGLTGALPRLDLVGLAALVALATGNAATEYLAALARNLGETRIYARLVALRHGFTLTATLATAALTGEPRLTLLAFAASVWPGVLYGTLALGDGRIRPNLVRLALARRYLGYGVPLIAAETAFQGISLVNRLWLADRGNLAAVGIYALTVDLAFRIVAVTASVTEAALLPRLIAREAELGSRTDGASTVGRDLRRLVGAMLIVTVASAGAFWAGSGLVSAVLLGPDYRAGFAEALPTALVCAWLYALQTYVLRPIFQIGLRTGPLLQSAALALAVDIAVLAATGAHEAHEVLLAQFAGLIAGAVLLLVRGLRAMPRAGDAVSGPAAPSPAPRSA